VKHLLVIVPLAVLTVVSPAVLAQDNLTWPPALPSGKLFRSDTTKEFLTPPESLQNVAVAKTPPQVDFYYYPGQDYPGKPWSNWGDGSVAGTKYYSAIGDHKAPQGNGLVFEYDSETQLLRQLASTAKTIVLPEGHYTPGKIHSRVDLGSDGWLYYSTHRGSTRVTTDEYHYKGDWLLRTNPATRKTEIVAHGPVPKTCIPTSVLDPDRLIFYGGTAAGDRLDKTVTFFAYDIRKRKVLHTAVPGARRYLIFARSTGCVYYMDEVADRLMKYDPASGKPPKAIAGTLGLRAATEELPGNVVYTVGQKDDRIFRFHTKTEKIEQLGPFAIGSQTYVATLDADPTGRYLYYIPGAHGSSYRDGTAVIQFDTQKGTRKVIAFLYPFYEKQIDFVPIGTYGSAVSPDGSKLFVTWNGCRGGKVRGKYPFNTCALTVIHIPESERQP
jgi:hypothetical protein